MPTNFYDYVLTIAHDPGKNPQQKLQEICAQIMEYTYVALESDKEELIRENTNDEILCVIREQEEKPTQCFILDAKNRRSADLTLMNDNYLSIQDRLLSPMSVEGLLEFYAPR